jgi:hypothetical protein
LVPQDQLHLGAPADLPDQPVLERYCLYRLPLAGLRDQLVRLVPVVLESYYLYQQPLVVRRGPVVQEGQQGPLVLVDREYLVCM